MNALRSDLKHPAAERDVSDISKTRRVLVFCPEASLDVLSENTLWCNNDLVHGERRRVVHQPDVRGSL